MKTIPRSCTNTNMDPLGRWWIWGTKSYPVVLEHTTEWERYNIAEKVGRGQDLRLTFPKYGRTLWKGIEQVGMYQTWHLGFWCFPEKHLMRTILIVEDCSFGLVVWDIFEKSRWCCQAEIIYTYLEFQGNIWIACACLKDNRKQIVIVTNGVN